MRFLSNTTSTPNQFLNLHVPYTTYHISRLLPLCPHRWPDVLYLDEVRQKTPFEECYHYHGTTICGNWPFFGREPGKYEDLGSGDVGMLDKLRNEMHYDSH